MFGVRGGGLLADDRPVSCPWRGHSVMAVAPIRVVGKRHRNSLLA